MARATLYRFMYGPQIEMLNGARRVHCADNLLISEQWMLLRVSVWRSWWLIDYAIALR